MPPPTVVEGERKASGQEGHLKFPFLHTNLSVSPAGRGKALHGLTLPHVSVAVTGPLMWTRQGRGKGMFMFVGVACETGTMW